MEEAERLVELRLKISSWPYNATANNIENVLRTIPGVKNIYFNFNRRIAIVYSSNTLHTTIKELEKVGFTAEEFKESIDNLRVQFS